MACLLFLMLVWGYFMDFFYGVELVTVTASVATIVTLMFSICIFCLGSFHLRLALLNMTSLENFVGGFGGPNQYDKGSFYENWVSVFGRNPRLMLIPVPSFEDHKGWGYQLN